MGTDKKYSVMVCASIKDISGIYEVEAEDEFEAREKAWAEFIKAPIEPDFEDNYYDVKEIE